MMTPQERIDNYHKVTGFPQSLQVANNNELMIGGDKRIIGGTWIMGNNYQRAANFYGAYPHGYLRRIRALFPDASNVLHIFSGKVNTSELPGDTVDINPDLNPTYLDDAQTLNKVPIEDYDLILADPPYSVEDADRYKTTMIKRNKVMDVLGRRANPNTIVVFLDQVLPQFRKVDWAIIGLIGMMKSTNHRFRMVVIFQHR